MSDQQWFIEREGRIIGPLTASDLKKLARANKINTSTRVRLGEGTWRDARCVKGLFNEIAAVPPVTAAAKIRPSTPAPQATSQVIESTPSVKACPFCGESILLQALKCKHCGELLDASLRAAAKPQYVSIPHAQPNVTIHNRVGIPHKRWNASTAMLLSLVIPGLGQIYKGQTINGIAWFVVTVVGYVALIVPGVIVHLCCVIGAASGDPYR